MCRVWWTIPTGGTAAALTPPGILWDWWRPLTGWAECWLRPAPNSQPCQGVWHTSPYEPRKLGRITYALIGGVCDTPPRQGFAKGDFTLQLKGSWAMPPESLLSLGGQNLGP